MNEECEQIKIKPTIYVISFCIALVIVPVAKSICYYELIGFSGSEVYGHAWTHWWRAIDFPTWSTGTSLTLGTEYFPSIDPIPTIISILFSFIGGTAFGYNSWVCLAMFFAAYGGFQLCKKEGGDPWIGAIILAWSPIMLGSVASGLTEDMAVGVTALAFALLGSRPIISGLLLGIVGWCGLVLGWMSGIFALCLGFRLLCQGKKQVFFSGLLTLLLVSPLLYLHWERLTLNGHRFGVHDPNFEPLWALNPWKQIDVASLFYPGKQSYADEIIRLHPGYIGFTLIFVACCSRTIFWWGMLFLFVGLSLGPSIHWAGYDTEIGNVISYSSTFIPGQALINHHGRYMLMVLLALSVLVSKGIKKLPRIKFWRLLIALELFLASPIGFFLPGSPRMDTTFLSSIEASKGRILRVPTSGPGVSFQQALWEQTVHKKELFLNPNRPGAGPLFPQMYNFTWIDQLAFNKEIPDEICFPKNISGILVQHPYGELLSVKIGKPSSTGQQFSFWDQSKLSLSGCP